ncbi:secretion system protein F [Corynebacterium sp. HMSC05E07]|nr:secretion system protein F [Corynebacterium sp. HMSC05E07]
MMTSYLAAVLLAAALAVATTSPAGRVGLGTTGTPRPKTPRDGPDYGPLDAASDLELFAACLEAGLSPRTSVVAVAEASSPWKEAAALVGVGVPMKSVWQALSSQPHLVELVRLAQLSGESGTAMATGCHRLVAQLRAEASAQATAQAERAGIFIAAPLAACFLPAFLVLGLVPVIISLGQQLL